MAECVGTDRLMNAGRFDLRTDNMENHHADQTDTPPIQKQGIFKTFLDNHLIAIVEVFPDFVQSCFRDGYEALLATFSFYSDKLLVEINIRIMIEIGRASCRERV